MSDYVYKRLSPIPAKTNNFWFRYSPDCETAIVFVHGIFSDSRDCWTAKGHNGEPDIFWPDLVDVDRERIGAANVFMGGFYTATDAGSYDVFDCSRELFSSLGRTDEFQHRSVLTFPKIVFVCHSTGGIVVRHALVKHRNEFANKTVALALIASPSSGSALASMLSGLASIYNSKLALQLSSQSPAIEELDRNFKDLVHDACRGFELVGIEGYENRFIIHRKWFPDVVRVVTADSAGKYFGAPIHLPMTDHFSAVKPRRTSDSPHLLLVDLFARMRAVAQRAASINFGIPSIRQTSPALKLGETATSDKNVVEIRFTGTFLADPISIANVLKSYKRNDTVPINVTWSSELSLLRGYLQRAMSDATSFPRHSSFAGLSSGMVADFVEGWKSFGRL